MCASLVRAELARIAAFDDGEKEEFNTLETVTEVTSQAYAVSSFPTSDTELFSSCHRLKSLFLAIAKVLLVLVEVEYLLSRK